MNIKSQRFFTDIFKITRQANYNLSKSRDLVKKISDLNYVFNSPRFRLKRLWNSIQNHQLYLHLIIYKR